MSFGLVNVARVFVDRTVAQASIVENLKMGVSKGASTRSSMVTKLPVKMNCLACSPVQERKLYRFTYPGQVPSGIEKS